MFFQAREAADPFYAAVPEIVQAKLDQLAARTGRRYGLVDYAGAPERVKGASARVDEPVRA